MTFFFVTKRYIYNINRHPSIIENGGVPLKIKVDLFLIGSLFIHRALILFLFYLCFFFFWWGGGRERIIEDDQTISKNTRWRCFNFAVASDRQTSVTFDCFDSLEFDIFDRLKRIKIMFVNVHTQEETCI